MRSRKFQFMVMSAFLGLAMVGCSPVSDNSLLTDRKDDNASLTVDKTPKAEELYLKLDTASIGPAVTGSKLEISGECYTSTYPGHRIVATEGNATLDIVDVTAASSANDTAQCRNGRFNFSLNIASPYPSGGHQVRVSLIGVDGLGAPVYNDSQASSILSFTK